MSQMSQFRFKSGIEIVLPVPRRGAFSRPSSEGAKECSSRFDERASALRREIKWKDIAGCMGHFLSPLRGFGYFSGRLHPRLAPWAAFFRRFAAAVRRSL